MRMNARTVDTVRERERELHFSNRKCSIVQQSDTHTLCLVNNKRLAEKAKKQEKVNKIKRYKQEKKPILR